MGTTLDPRRAPYDRDELQSYVNGLDGAELAMVASQIAHGGAPDRALELCALSRAAGKGSRGMVLCEARAHWLLGRADLALEAVEAVVSDHPDDASARFVKSQLLAELGHVDASRQSLERLVSMAPDYPGALAALARLAFPGPGYREVLRWLHALLRPVAYLEIGVEHGESLALAHQSSVIVGVDPAPQVPPGRRPPKARVLPETSDEFFEKRSLSDVTGGRPFDLVFIDGLHTFEQTLADFAHAEAWCHERSTIVLHDCLVVSPVAASRRRRTRFWVGDCWKALQALSIERPELELGVVPTFPSGLVVVRRLNPRCRVLAHGRQRILDVWRESPTPPTTAASEGAWQRIENDPAAVRSFLTGTQAP